jgi:hypothetical protein
MQGEEIFPLQTGWDMKGALRSIWDRGGVGTAIAAAAVIIGALLVLRRWLSAFDLATRQVVVVAGIILGVIVLAVVVGVRFFDLSGRREDEAQRLQDRIAERVRGVTSNVAITIVAEVPGARRSPVVIEVAGAVPTDTVRDRVLRVVRHETSRIGRDARVVDRLEVGAATATPTTSVEKVS